jgi:membrane glycosyltransferase
LTYGKQAIQWRRARILELDSQGYTHREIVSKLQIAKGTVSNDLAYLRKQAQENLQHHIHETVPEEYQRGMVGLRQNQKYVLEIAETASDPRVKLQARAIANESYKIIMDLATNGVIVNDALRCIQSKIEHLHPNLNTLKLERDEKTEQAASATATETKEGDQKTTNGVF